MPQPPMRRGPVPAIVRMDRFAMFQFVRRYSLSGADAWMLQALAYLADWETHHWQGAILELAQDTGQTTGIVKRSLDHLDGKELIAIRAPFTRYARGQIEVLCYAVLVPGKSVPRWKVDEQSLDDRYADSLSTSAPDLHLSDETLRNKDAVKEGGLADESRDRVVQNKQTIGAVRRAFPKAVEVDPDEPFD